MKLVSTALVFAFLIVSSLALAGEPAKAEAKDQAPAWLKAGTVMTYGVDFYGKNYDFIITIKTLTPEVSFDWKMTAPVNSEGSVVIKAEALATAMDQDNFFSGGPKELSDKTTVWVSKAVMDQYRSGNIEKQINTGSGPDLFLPTQENPEKTYAFKLDGKDTSLGVMDIKGINGHRLWILDNLAAPIIFKMDLGWKIWLKEIKPAA